MIMAWKTNKIIAMALVLTMAEGFVSYCAFRNMSIALSEKKSLVESWLAEIRNSTQATSPASSMRIIYGPNGSKDVTFCVSASMSVGTSVSGEAERTYLLTLGFLEALGSIVDLLRNASIITAITACVICVALIMLGLKKMPRPSIPSL